MTRLGIFISAAFLLLLSLPFGLSADYLYPGSAGLQPLAVIEPATPDSLFHSWTGNIDQNGRSNLGISLDFLRNPDNSDDWDEILSITGSFRSGEKLVYGVTIPYIVRDPKFNESGLLDLRAFARMRLLGNTSGFGVSGELSAILPTARADTTFPFSLDSPVAGLRLAFFGGTNGTTLGLNLGYQSYLQTESGNDSDMLYSAWLEMDLNSPWSMTAEFSGSMHRHTGPPGDDDVSDGYIQLGVRRAHSKKLNFGIAAGSGIGGDRAADIRITALATMKFGTIEEKKPEKRKAEEKKRVEEKEKEIVKEKKAAPPPSAIVVVMIGEGITSRETERKITKALQKKGYATGTDPRPGIKGTDRNVLYYMPGMEEQALNVSRVLISGGHLKDLQIKESQIRIPRNWLMLILGGEK
jgi:hypothetical protein